MQSDLAAAFKDLQGDVGFFLGFGRGTAFGDEEWDDRQQNSITRCVKGGLRNFYHCGYDWSFLKPVASIALSEGSQTAALPDDFGGLEGMVTVSATGEAGYSPIPVMGDVRPHYASSPDRTGRPAFCCIDPLRGRNATRGQEFELFVFPEPDRDYTFQFAYYLNPAYLTGAFPYAYGGAQHAETLLEACLAVAEKLQDDQATVHATEFDRRMQVSLMLDRRNKPQKLGYNADRSDRLTSGRGHMHNFGDHALPITFDGVTPT